MRSAPSANVHQYLLPVMTQWSPSSTARVRMPPYRSEPASGSESAAARR